MSTMLYTPAQLVETVRRWLGTAFHHQGRICATSTHRGGCDCIGLVMGVAAELQICSRQSTHPFLSHVDRCDYPRLPRSDVLETALDTHFYSVERQALQAGDVVLFAIDQNGRHVGILTPGQHQPFGLIHAYAQARKVVEHDFDNHWQDCLIGAYRFHGIIDNKDK
jgi:cell wall-associated NlpC family hydrolase